MEFERQNHYKFTYFVFSSNSVNNLGNSSNKRCIIDLSNFGRFCILRYKNEMRYLDMMNNLILTTLLFNDFLLIINDKLYKLLLNKSDPTCLLVRFSIKNKLFNASLNSDWG